MKCSKCGAEIRLGSVYCESCGQPAQIVPDYNILEDDFLVSLLDEEKNGKKENASTQETLHANQKKANSATKNTNSTSKNINAASKNTKKPKKKKWYQNMKVLIPVIVIILLIVVAIFYYFFSYTSYAGYVNRGLAKDEEEAYEEAVILYEKAITKDDTQEKAYILAADDYFLLEEYDQAISYYQTAIEINSNSTSAYQGLINTYLVLGDYDALDELEASTSNVKILALFDESIIDPPVFSESGGSYDDDLELTLTSADGYAIYYTTDDSAPTGSGRILYEGEISLTEGTTTIKAVCYDGESYSQVISNTYTISYEKPTVESVSPSSGTYTTPTQVTITLPEGSVAYYTWDGTTPTESSDQYTGPLDMPEGNHILSVIIVDAHGQKSDVTQFNYKYIPE